MLLALHKPYGVLSQFTAEVPGQRTLAEFGLPRGVYPVGRLDRDSEGLLLLTDDMRLRAYLTDPRSRTPKMYWVQVEGRPTEAQLAHWRRGPELWIRKRVVQSLPARVGLLGQPDVAERAPPIRTRLSVPTAWLWVELTEGKNRQVRRMGAAVGLPVLRLIRITVGHYRLDGLPVGEWREVCLKPPRS